MWATTYVILNVLVAHEETQKKQVKLILKYFNSVNPIYDFNMYTLKIIAVLF